MELTEQQKQTVLDIIFWADGEDMEEIINKSGFLLLNKILMKN